ncbi:MAG TPA: ankyrin repeat domain-containing protein, partial [Planctomycetes bacterium]|nr:ankyrin repeat domain-containing protein [Planctomycetota bacterium]
GLAAAAGQVDACKFLLDKGAEVSAKSADGNTPLHAAAFFGRVKVVELLIEAGAEIDAKADGGDTPLDAAAGEWTEDLEGIFKFFGEALGLEVDLAAIKSNRPKAAAVLRAHGAKSGK